MTVEGPRITAVVLAAGAGSRFGGGKLLASVDGKPILQHVLDAIAAAGLVDVVVVLGDDADEIERTIAWRSEGRIRNPDARRGLSSSVRLGLGAVDPSADGALFLLGDQPTVRSEVIDALVSVSPSDGRTIVVPRYIGGGGPNPVVVHRGAFDLASALDGDRGFGPLIAARRDLVEEVGVDGSNPDVDTRGDLALLAERMWADRVRDNREQVDRVREVGDGDFYATTTSLFVADPRRSDEDDPSLAALRALARPEDTWLDIGTGAGRYALPLALAAREVIAVDPSPGMLAALRQAMATYGIGNVRVIEGRWPLPEAELPLPAADVALIAHVGYDIETIGPFLDAMERSARRLCVAVLMERTPASIAEPFWPPIHGQQRVPLPALPAFVDLLRARGRTPEIRQIEREQRTFLDRETVLGFLRRQTWVAVDGEKDRRLQALVDERLVANDDGSVGLTGVPDLRLGLVTWAPGKPDN
jgi:molybdenum cofactor cytidylyltransferase